MKKKDEETKQQWLGEIGGLPEAPPDAIAPKSITVDLTHDCIFKCKGCIEASSMRKSGRTSLRTGTVLQIIEIATQKGVKIFNFYGGEPTLHGAFGRIVRFTAKRAGKIRIITNGSQLIKEQIADSIAEASRCTEVEVRVSLNAGTEKTHDSLHGVKGFFKLIVEGIQFLMNHPNKIQLGISYLAEEENTDELEKAYDIARRVSAKYFTVRPKTGPHGIGISQLSPAARNALLQGIERLQENYGKLEPELQFPKWYLAFLKFGRMPNTSKPYPACWFCANSRLVITPPEPGVAWSCPYWRGDDRFKIADLAEVPYGTEEFERCRVEAIRRISPSRDCAHVICNRHEENKAVWSVWKKTKSKFICARFSLPRTTGPVSAANPRNVLIFYGKAR